MFLAARARSKLILMNARHDEKTMFIFYKKPLKIPDLLNKKPFIINELSLIIDTYIGRKYQVECYN